MNTQSNPNLITVRMSTVFSVLFLVLGSLLLLAALLTLLAGGISLHLILGPLFITIGVLSFSKPYCAYDSATGALYMYALLGFQMAAYGSPKNERIYFDPTKAKVMRARPDGKQSKVNTFGVNRNELARLTAALPQQQAA